MLEPRILYSADHPLAAAALVQQLPQDQGPSQQGRAELVVIDARVEGAATLMADIAAQAHAGRDIGALLIAPGDDAIELISRALARQGHDGVAALHLVGHGSAGEMQLGSTTLDAATLLQQADRIAAWGQSLQADADLLLYGCDVAASRAGVALIDNLSQLTGADVAASDDLTGARALGGDWQLEASTGRIDADIAFSARAQADWQGTLANSAPVITPKAPGASQTATTVNGSGTPVGSLIASAFSDADAGALKGIAITGLNAGNGAWQFSTNAGSTWTTVWSASDSSALLLRDTDRVRFVPNGATATTATLTYRGWDQTSGSAGASANTTTNGGSTAFSSATDGYTVTVSAVNSAPGVHGAGSGITLIDANVSTDESVQTVLVQPDGKTVTVGWNVVSGVSAFGVYRFNADGSIDTSFGVGATGGTLVTLGALPTQAFGAALQADGKIVAVGTAVSGGNTVFYVVRLTRDGFLDATFDGDGGTTIDIASGADVARAVAIQADGRIVVAGYGNNGSNDDFVAVRLNSDGSLDTSFDGDGKVITAIGSSNDTAVALTLQSDGRIVLAGNSNNGSNLDVAVVRYLANGALDTSFDGDGKRTIAVGTGDELATAVVQQPSDGKLVLAGRANIAGSDDMMVMRLTTSGASDTSFDGDGVNSVNLGGTENVYGMALQSDGKVLIAGRTLGTSSNTALARWTSAGALDTSFNGSGTLTVSLDAGNDLANAVALTADQRIVAGGTAGNKLALLRLNPNGSFDDSLGATSAVPTTASYTEDAAPVLLSPTITFSDNDLNLAGSYAGATVTLARNGGANGQDTFSATGLLRGLAPGGSLVYAGVAIGTVTTNGNGTLLLTFNANATQALLNGALRCIAYSNSSNTPGASVQLDWTFSDGNSGAQGSGGALTSTTSTTVTLTASDDVPSFVTLGGGKFTLNLTGYDDKAAGTLVQPDGKILVAGLSWTGTSNDFFLARFNADGTPDIGFGTNGRVFYDFAGRNDNTYGLVLQADGKIIVTGDINTTGTSFDFGMVRFNANGTLDTNFGTGGKVQTDFTGRADYRPRIAVDHNGNIVLAGTTNTATGNDFALARYTSTGALDTSFGSGGRVTTNVNGHDDEAFGLVIQDDNRIVVVGQAHNGSNLDVAVVRYLVNGSLDTSFGGTGIVVTAVGTGDDAAHAVLLQPDGKLVVGGSTYGSNNNFLLLRYTSSGVLDTTFGSNGITVSDFNGYADSIQSLALTSGGQIIALGDTIETGRTDLAIARYNADGTLDTTFDSDGKVMLDFVAYADTPAGVAVQADGRVVVAGSVYYGNNFDISLARLSTNGSLDTSFGNSSINGSAAYTENNPAVVLDSDAGITDAELGAVDNYAGATLTLVRHGGASGEDRYSALGGLSALTQGAALVYGGITVGSVTTNASGTLVLTFNANATVSLVNSVLRNIGYLNSNDTPPATVQIDWTFSDGNAGAQGSGGARSAIGYTTVGITATNDAPVISSNGGGSSAAVNVAENGTGVTTVIASDPEGAAITYDIVGGADAAFFTIDAATGVLTFIAPPDYETRLDAGSNNVYDVTVSASDGVVTTTQAIAVTVTPVNDNTPVITSGGALASTGISVDENTALATTVTASDADLPAQALTFTLTGGADMGRFSINASTGALTFNVAPDYENPLDADGDNRYEVVVSVSDGFGSDNQAITVTVLGVNDNTPVIGSNGGPANAALDVAENTSVVTTVVATDADRPLLAPTYSISGGADAARFVIHPTTGVLTFVNAPDAEAPLDADHDNVYVVTVRASDGSLSSTQTLTITVTPVNEATPVITSGGGGASATASVAENTTAVTTVAATDADTGEAPLVYRISGGADAARFVIDAATGALRFAVAPDAEAPTDAGADGVYDVEVTVDDGLHSDSQTIAVTVTPVNDNDPVIAGGASAALGVDENTTAVTAVLASDADRPTQSLSYTLAGADAARFTIDANGVLRFAAAPDHEAPLDADADNVYEVTVTVSDGSRSASQALSVSVADVNEAPVITSHGGGATGSASTAENVTLVGNIAAADPDRPRQDLSYSITGGVDRALFEIDDATGTLRFIGAPDYENPLDANHDNLYQVVVSVSDGSLDSSQALTVRVTPVNDNTPVITSGAGATAAISIDENDTEVTSVSATDADRPNEALSFTISGGPDAALFAIDAATGALSFRIAPDYELPADAGHDNVYELTVQVSDGTRSDSQAITVTVTDANDNAPVITSNNGGATAAVSVAENATLVTTMVASDADTPVPTYAITGGADAALFHVDATSGVLTFITPPDFEAPADTGADNRYVVTVTVSDGSSSDSQTLTVTVTPVDDNLPQITSDGGGASANLAVDEGSAVATTVTASDADRPRQTLVFAISGGADAACFVIDAATGVLSFASTPDAEAPLDADHDNVYQVRVRVGDGTSFDTQDLVIEVRPVDDNPPHITSGSAFDVDENQLIAATVTASDADRPAQGLVFSIGGGADAARFTIDAATGVLSFATRPDYEAPQDAGQNNVYDVTVQVSDGFNTDTRAIVVTVRPVDDNPTVISSHGGGSSATITLAENIATVGSVIASDADRPAQALVFSLDGDDAALFGIDANGVLRFLAAPDYEASRSAGAPNVYQVTVRASDGSSSDTQALTINITPVNDNLPVITSGGGAASLALNLDENLTAVTTVSASDADQPGETLVYSIAGGADAARFTIDPASGALRFVDPPDYENARDAGRNNVYDVEVQASDGSLTTTQAIVVTVGNVNDNAPQITSDGGGATAGVDVAENDLAVTRVTTTDADGPTPAPVFSIAGGVDAAFFRIDAASGELTFRTAPDHEAPLDSNHNNVYNVIVEVGDGTSTTRQAIAVRVTPVNDNAPVITSDGGGSTASIGIDENETAVTTVTVSDADDPVVPPLFSIDGGADQGLFRIDAHTGALSFIGAPDFETPLDADGDNHYVVRLRVDDGDYSVMQTLTVEVRPTNDSAPVITSDGGNATATLNVAENSSVLTTVTASDGDHRAFALTYSIAGGMDSDCFDIDAATGVLSWRVPPDYERPDDYGGDNVYVVTVQASDGSLTGQQTLEIAVHDVNEAPTITSHADGATVPVAENGSAVATITGADPDRPAQALVYSLGGADAARFTLDAATGVLRFRTAPDFEAPADADADNVYLLTLRCSDGSLSTEQSLRVAVTPVDDNAPRFTSAAGARVDENDTTVMTVTAHDADAPAQALRFSLVGGADRLRFAIDADSGALRFVAAPDFEAPADADGDNVYELTVQVSDGSSVTLQALTVTVVARNESAPRITSDGGGATAALDVAENDAHVKTVVGSDADGDPLRYAIGGGADAARFTIDPASGVLRFRQAPDFEAPDDADGDNVYELTVQVSDGSRTAQQALIVTIVNVNDHAPRITSDGGGATAALGVAENTTHVTRVAGTDDDGDALRYAISGGADAARFTIDPSTGVLSFVAAPDFDAPPAAHADNRYTLVVSVSDGGSVATQVLTITVTPLNDNAPVLAGAAAFEVAENTSAVTTVQATDADAGRTDLRYSLAGGADARLFTIDAATGALSFVHAPDFETPHDAGAANVYQLTVRVSDGSFSAEQALRVSVTPVNDNTPQILSNGAGPSAVIELSAGDRAVTTVAARDADAGGVGARLHYAIAGGTDAARFSLDATTGALRLLAPARAGSHLDVVVSASDGEFHAEQRLQIRVPAAPEPPAPPPPHPEPPVPPPPPAPPPAPPPSAGPGLEPGPTPRPDPGPVAPTPAPPPREAVRPGVAVEAQGTGPAAPVPSAAVPMRLGAAPDMQALSIEATPLRSHIALAIAAPRSPESLEPLQALMIRLRGPGHALADPAGGPGRSAPERALTIEAEAPLPAGGVELTQVNTAVAGALSATAAALLWASRGGALVTSLMATAPTWRRFDVLPVLRRERDENEIVDSVLQADAEAAKATPDEA